MYCNRLHAWWSTQSRLATLLSSLIARGWVGLQTLWWLWLQELFIDEMVGAWCFGCLSGPPGFTCWISFALVLFYLLLSPYLCFISLLYLDLYVSGDDALISYKPNIYVSWSTSELRVRLAPLNRFKLSCEIIFTDRSKAVLLLWIVFVVYASCWFVLFFVALWSPARIGLTSWLSCVFCFVIFPNVPCPHQNQGWGWRRETGLSPPVKYFTDRSNAVLLLWIFFFCLVFAMSLCVSVYMCFVVTCWERADLLALVCGVLLWICHFPIGILGQV